MAYFLPSFFQKRLLRYALSRLELVDTEALDLDSLGIRWGQRSTVELRDIGLRLDKLSTLLHLPVSSELVSARVGFLKITVPADIYSSGIICQASGIDVHLKLLSDETRHAGQGDRPMGSGPGHDSGSDPIIPNPTDLAQSFLQAEPKEEKEELKAAISSQSQVLHRTPTSGSDDEEELGYGNEGVSLPSFVAAFLKGVADRLQVQVDDIAIRVDMETKQEAPLKRQPEDKPDLVTGLLTVGQVKVDAVSSPSSENEASSRNQRRLISFSDINVALVSEPVVFSNYSRFTAPTSPESTSPASPLQPKPSPPPSHASSPPSEHASEEDTALDLTRSIVFEPTRGMSESKIIEQYAPEMEGSVYTYDGRFSDADTEEETRSYGYMEESQNLPVDDEILDNPAYLDSVIDSHLHDDELDGIGHFSPEVGQRTLGNEDTPRLRTPELHAVGSASHYSDTQNAMILAPRSQVPVVTSLAQDQLQYPEAVDVPTRPALPAIEPGVAQDPQLYADNQTSPVASVPPSEASSTSSTSGSFNQEELSESRLFSTEEAQSMYMSAISHDSMSRSFMPNIPGAWDSPESTVVRDSPAHVHHDDGRDVHHMDQDHEDDEEAIATPKLTAQAGSHISQECLISDSPEAHGPTDKEFPQGSTGLNKFPDVARRFFSIDKVVISIPSVDEDGDGADDTPSASYTEENTSGLEETTACLRDSVAEDYFAPPGRRASTRSRSDTIRPASYGYESSRPSQSDGQTQSKRSQNDMEIEVFSAELQFDIAIGWLVLKVGHKILHAFSNDNEVSQNTGQPQEVQKRQAIKLALRNLSIKFVEHVPGHSYPGETDSSPLYGLLHNEILLQTCLSGLESHLSIDKDITKLHLNIKRFSLGFASEHLISFSEDFKMRDSVRDVLSAEQGDIDLSITKSPDSTTVNLMTLPLQLNMNIQRLEEAIGWFGGLSTILELGNSISSASSGKGPKNEAPKRPRGVHFEEFPPPTASEGTGSAPLKVNVRIGGLAADVVGETHYVKLRTTAAKIISRPSGIAVQIDKAKLNGPLPLDDARDAPAKLNLTDIRIEYRFSPKEEDLDRLLGLITPSKDKYDEDDDIMLDTLFRQRRQGSVLCVTISGARVAVSRTTDLDSISQLADELSRLSNVTKYLPEDDRPGVLTLALIRELEVLVHLGGKVGDMSAILRNTELAFISLPSLIAAQLGSITVARNRDEELVGEASAIGHKSSVSQSPLPVLMARYIADEMDPTVKVKLHNFRAEYKLPSIIAFLGLSDDMTTGDVAANMASSLANLAELQPPHHDVQAAEKGERSDIPSKPIKLTVDLRDCVLGLNPRGTGAKGLVVLTNAKFSGAIHDPVSSDATLELRKASVMIIDDVANVGYADNVQRRSSAPPHSNQVQSFIEHGFVTVCTISSATAIVKIVRLSDDGAKSLDVELRDDLLILETCADSTQTLISILNGLQPPTPPSTAAKYRTEVLPIQDMLSSFTGDAFFADTPEPSGSTDSADQDQGEGYLEDERDYVSDFKHVSAVSEHGSLTEGMMAGSNELLDSFHSQCHVSSSLSELDFREDHFAQKSAVGGTAHRWDSTHHTYGLPDDSKLQNSPLRIRVRDAHVIWNLFDGYDWQRTRDTISKAVKDVERKAIERRARAGSRASPSFDDEEESVIGDCLFNSIYIGVPANKDPRDIRNDINRNIDDLASETGSYATTTTVTGATVRQSQSPSVRGKKLRLSRSKYHKMTFELKGICADLVIFPPDSGETQSSLDVRIKDLEVFDHVPTSTWKKFATYMHEAGEKESGTSMVHLEILTVKPVPQLAATEIVLKATILPLRLHVDQDALDFICRFFEFRDDSAPTPTAPSDVPFLQRVEVNAVPVRLDFKPKRVDYAGLRSGRTTEFMNFFILDAADMTMRHVIIYGVSGFDKLGQTLNDIWMPDIKRNQLPGVLAGLAPIRSLVNVGGGVKDLVAIPVREYRKDGRLVRSIQKGALSFAKTTSNELVKLGAKLAIGTQTVLQGAEDILTAPNAPGAGVEDEYGDDEEAKKISLYADQPVGVIQGLRGAFRGLERDLLVTRDAIVAVPGEVIESGSAKAAAKAVWKRAPTVVLRPAIGVSKAVGQTLLGAGNTLDPSNRRKMEDKYKHH
ncbi:autophagy-protein 2 [Aspergillus brasiliensis]|uniref:Autophagy-related protein 2 n=1 Tax=Aspergillus brasiliensis TaxID=319629 RepID=A0A9W5YWM7_9EURO|nr:autophagy-protein 2 [Aspergillus brasiliensis]GKZ49720.1 autophagy-protein 2 [Aspergillus brasiliensis]